MEGVDSYVVDVTPPDVREVGLRVAKAVAPRLQPIDVAHDQRFLGGERIYRAAYDRGLVERPFSQLDINPYPHPFP